MSNQALPDDILLGIVEDYLDSSTGYSNAERVQMIKTVSLTSKALAVSSRRFIFERTMVTVGGSWSEVGSECPVNSLRGLLEANPSYVGFIKSLRIESRLLCTMGGGVDDETDLDDEFYDSLGERQHENSVSVRYTSSTSEEAAICWLLAQGFPNLHSFHFIIRPVRTAHQDKLRRSAFKYRSPLIPSKWSPSLLDPAASTQPRVVAACLPEAVLRFLSMDQRSFDRLTLSSNLPSNVLRYVNGRQRSLKYLCLTKLSEMEPLADSEIEVPFLLGMDTRKYSTIQEELEVDILSCDASKEELKRWFESPERRPLSRRIGGSGAGSSIGLKSLQSLHLRALAEGNTHFPFSKCAESLTTLKLVYPDQYCPKIRGISEEAPKALRCLTIGRDLRMVDDPSRLGLFCLWLEDVNTASIELFEIVVRISHSKDPNLPLLLKPIDGYISNRIARGWGSLKMLRVTVSLPDEEWVQGKAGKQFHYLTREILLTFSALSTAPSVSLDVDIVRDSDYSLWKMDS
ncbi:hypothetical protein NMY22_g14391 [Coprinellus aureogranulatus]|nr:hypothetical protein NMY22_g14391 [Coprinellus aureogranulatus]